MAIERRLIDEEHPSNDDRMLIVLRDELIKTFHDQLYGLIIPIVMAFRGRKPKPGEAVARAIMPSEDVYVASGIPFILLIYGEAWNQADAATRQAIVDHELTHMDYDRDSEKRSLRNHDLQDFVEVYERNGPYWPDLAMVEEIALKKMAQEDAGKGDGEVDEEAEALYHKQDAVPESEKPVWVDTCGGVHLSHVSPKTEIDTHDHMEELNETAERGYGDRLAESEAMVNADIYHL